MSFLHGLSSHRTKSCLLDVDETSNNDQDSGNDKNDRSTVDQQQQLSSRTSSLVLQADQEHHQQQHQLNVRMRRHPELVPVMPRERDLGLSTSSRNSNNKNNNNKNGCSNSSSLTRPHLRATNNSSRSNSSSSSCRNHPMSASYMGQQQIFPKNQKDTFAKPQPKRCVSMTRLDQLAQPKRIFTKETIQSKPSTPSSTRINSVRLRTSTTEFSRKPPTRSIPTNKAQASPSTTSISRHKVLKSLEPTSISNDPISSQPEVGASSLNSSATSTTSTTSTLSPETIKSVKPSRASLNNGSSLFDELNSDSSDLLNQSTQNPENPADSTLSDFKEIQPESPASKSDKSTPTTEITQNEFNSSMDELCADMNEASILSSVYHSPSSFREENQESFQSIVNMSLDSCSKDMIQFEKNSKPKLEDNEFLLRIKKEDEEKRLREEEELKELLRKEEKEREDRKKILDGIMRRVSKPTTPKSGQESKISNGTLNDAEHGNLDSSGTIMKIEPIEAPVNY